MIRPDIITVNNVDRDNGDITEVRVWAIRKDEDAHPAGICVYIEGKSKTLEFTLPAAEVAQLLWEAVTYMDNTVERIPFTYDDFLDG